MKKPRKHYNPRKYAGAGGELILSVNSLPGSGIEPAAQRDHAIRALSPIDMMRDSWCTHAYRALTHLMRLLINLANTLSRPDLHATAIRGQQALLAIPNSNPKQPVVSTGQYHALCDMAHAFIGLLHSLPARILQAADAAARQTFREAAIGQYRSLLRAHDIMPALLAGHSLSSQLSTSDDEKALRDDVKASGIILHALMPDSSDYALPQTLAALRGLRQKIMPIWQQLDAELKASRPRLAA